MMFAKRAAVHVIDYILSLQKGNRAGNQVYLLTNSL